MTTRAPTAGKWAILPRLEEERGVVEYLFVCVCVCVCVCMR